MIKALLLRRKRKKKNRKNIKTGSTLLFVFVTFWLGTQPKENKNKQ